jgi:hypothetical protein
MVVRVPVQHSNKSEVFSIDFRETAPNLANETMYVDNPSASRFGGLSVGVPGELRGLEEAHKRWGSLPWKKLVQPAAELAAGWEVDLELGNRIPVSFHGTFFICNSPRKYKVVSGFDVEQSGLELYFRARRPLSEAQRNYTADKSIKNA